jgi:hypothetical protein
MLLIMSLMPAWGQYSAALPAYSIRQACHKKWRPRRQNGICVRDIHAGTDFACFHAAS